MNPDKVIEALDAARAKMDEIKPVGGAEARALAIAKTKIDECVLWLATLPSRPADE